MGAGEWLLANYLVFLVGYMSAAAIWCFAAAAIVATGRRFLSQVGLRIVYMATGLILLSLAVFTLYRLF